LLRASPRRNPGASGTDGTGPLKGSESSRAGARWRGCLQGGTLRFRTRERVRQSRGSAPSNLFRAHLQRPHQDAPRQEVIPAAPIRSSSRQATSLSRRSSGIHLSLERPCCSRPTDRPRCVRLSAHAHALAPSWQVPCGADEDPSTNMQWSRSMKPSHTTLLRRPWHIQRIRPSEPAFPYISLVAANGNPRVHRSERYRFAGRPGEPRGPRTFLAVGRESGASL
jgi:hypothetical protein